MKLLIVSVTFVLFTAVATIFFLKLRRLERAGGKIQSSPTEKTLLLRIIPGALLGNLTFQWFYAECGIKNTILSSAPFMRQFADAVCSVAFVAAGCLLVDLIIKAIGKYSQRNAAEQDAAANP